ncbi:probable Germin-like protein subfamily 3 member 1 [Coccomyxa sp. Obi]|nr:probable Germin-like protein subfamily 3 member 1 [Coccomyxa sp. Obi]
MCSSGYFRSATDIGSDYSAAARVFSYSVNTSDSNVKTPYGELLFAFAPQFPFLTTLAEPGITQLLFTLEPCSQFAPHSHPRGDELLQVISGSAKGGLIDEQNNIYPYQLGPLDFTVFPKGLSHYAYNDACEKATILATFTNIDPGTVLLVPTALDLPDLALQGALGVNSSMLADIRGSINKRTLFMSNNDPECYKKCNISPPAGS